METKNTKTGVMQCAKHGCDIESYKGKLFCPECEKGKADYVLCCKKCPNRDVNSKFCYNGKPCFECPSYNKPDSPEAGPPVDIIDMLSVAHPVRN